tara:strand:- start:41491 stop:46005 length:4515 start_codon:yes stop_codon:yes gene_type:complete
MKITKTITIIAIFILTTSLALAAYNTAQTGCCTKSDSATFCAFGGQTTSGDCCGDSDDACYLNYFKPLDRCEDITGCTNNVCCGEAGWIAQAACPGGDNGLNQQDCIRALNRECFNFIGDDLSRPLDDDSDNCANLEDFSCRSYLGDRELPQQLDCRVLTEDCSDITTQSLRITRVQPLGENNFEIRWVDTCSEQADNYIIQQQGSGWEDLVTLHRTVSHYTVSVPYSTTVVYRIKGIYTTPDGIINRYAETSINPGDEECQGRSEGEVFCSSDNMFLLQCNNNLINDITPDTGGTCIDVDEGIVSGIMLPTLPTCNFPHANPFGIFYSIQNCEFEDGRDSHCFYDSSDTIANDCYSCYEDDGSEIIQANCYDYKSEQTCGRDPCGAQDCEWKPDGEVGVCVSTTDNNCELCNTEPSLIETSSITNELIDFCDSSKLNLLSNNYHTCHISGISGEVNSCAETICRDLSISECGNSITLDQPILSYGNIINELNPNTCGLKVCRQFNNGCLKDANDNKRSDCIDEQSSVSGPITEACEKDIFPPTTSVELIEDENGVTLSLEFTIMDQLSSEGGETIISNDPEYKIYLCKGAECLNSKHPWPNPTGLKSLNVAGLDIQGEQSPDERYPPIITLDEGDNIIYYYTEDKNHNVEAFKKGEHGPFNQVTVTAFPGSRNPEIGGHHGVKVFPDKDSDANPSFPDELGNVYINHFEKISVFFTQDIDSIVTSESNLVHRISDTEQVELISSITTQNPNRVNLIPDDLDLDDGVYIFNLDVLRGGNRFSMSQPCPAGNNCLKQLVVDNQDPILKIFAEAEELNDGVSINTQVFKLFLKFEEIGNINLEENFNVRLLKNNILESGGSYRTEYQDFSINENTNSEKLDELYDSDHASPSFTDDVKTITLEPTESLNLEDGEYRLTISAIDLAGNRVQRTIDFSVDQEDLNIEFLNPRLGPLGTDIGYSATELHDIIIGTDNAAECQLFVDRIGTVNFQNTNNILHTISNRWVDGRSHTIKIICNGIEVYGENNDMSFGVDTQPPFINDLKVSPNFKAGGQYKISIPQEIQLEFTTVKENTKDLETPVQVDTVCSYEIDSQDPVYIDIGVNEEDIFLSNPLNYKASYPLKSDDPNELQNDPPIINLEDVNPGVHNIALKCYNKAGTQSTPENILININPSTLAHRVIEPTNSQTFYLSKEETQVLDTKIQIETSQKTWCDYSIIPFNEVTDFNQIQSTGPAYTHTFEPGIITLDLAEDTLDLPYYVRCSDLSTLSHLNLPPVILKIRRAQISTQIVRMDANTIKKIEIGYPDTRVDKFNIAIKDTSDGCRFPDTKDKTKEELTEFEIWGTERTGDTPNCEIDVYDFDNPTRLLGTITVNIGEGIDAPTITDPNPEDQPIQINTNELDITLEMLYRAEVVRAYRKDPDTQYIIEDSIVQPETTFVSDDFRPGSIVPEVHAITYNKFIEGDNLLFISANTNTAEDPIYSEEATLNVNFQITGPSPEFEQSPTHPTR